MKLCFVRTSIQFNLSKNIENKVLINQKGEFIFIFMYRGEPSLSKLISYNYVYIDTIVPFGTTIYSLGT